MVVIISLRFPLWLFLTDKPKNQRVKSKDNTKIKHVFFYPLLLILQIYFTLISLSQNLTKQIRNIRHCTKEVRNGIRPMCRLLSMSLDSLDSRR